MYLFVYLQRMRQLSVDTRVVRCLDYTADKGATKHSNVKQENYERVQ